LFTHQSSPETLAAARAVTTFLALVEAYTGAAVGAVAERAGDHGRIAEAYARRASEGGSGRRMLASFIGLEAPENQRAADEFVRAIATRPGWPALGRMWEDADAFPTDEEISDPESWLLRVRP
jgi:uncharacterized protein (DUF2342 family)